MKAVYFLILACLSVLPVPSSAQNRLPIVTPVRIAVPRVNLSPQHAPLGTDIRTTGYPTGPSFLPYPTLSTPSNDAISRQNAWAAYNAQLHRIPTAPNPNRLAPRQKLVDPEGLIQAPTSARRYNFQFSDNEIRSVQWALKIRGIYSGQVDGILGPDTRRAIATYQLQNKRPVTGQPDAGLNALLGIF